MTMTKGPRATMEERATRSLHENLEAAEGHLEAIEASSGIVERLWRILLAAQRLTRAERLLDQLDEHYQGRGHYGE